MESMTGYAFTEKSTDQFSYSVEIRCLNTKFLEIYTNLPRILENDENEFTMILKKFFSRGKIEMSIDVFDWSDTRPVSLNEELIGKYYRELKRVEKTLKLEKSFGVDVLLGMDGVVQRKRSVLSDKSRKDIFRTVNAMIRKAIEMRRREGRSIRKDLQNSLAVIVDSMNTIRGLVKNNPREQYDKLKGRIESLMEKKADDNRLYQEIAVLADKLDINEELVRLNDHIRKFKAVTGETGQVGKKLDFLAQEMFREINTIASKSNSSGISHLVVEMKNHIDKIREQCRNVV